MVKMEPRLQSESGVGKEKKKGRILSGMRPTGRLHLGNFAGALENWVQLQREYESFHFVADWHVLTTSFDKTKNIRSDTYDMIVDWLAAGIDPEISPMFIQSQIKEHTELHLIFSMLISVSRLERNPTVKEQARDLNLGDGFSYGHLGYPVLQAADILLYKANSVPVGEDQVPHVEITREIARRFNNIYGEVFPEPDAKITKFGRLPGLDAKRMSKSSGNVILLSEEPKSIEKKIKSAITDPEKIYKGDPGHPEICPIFAYQQKFNTVPEDIERIRSDCKSGALGCADDKAHLTRILVDKLEPFREKHAYYAEHTQDVQDIIDDGNSRAGEVAKATMQEVHDKMGIG